LRRVLAPAAIAAGALRSTEKCCIRSRLTSDLSREQFASLRRRQSVVYAELVSDGASFPVSRILGRASTPRSPVALTEPRWQIRDDHRCGRPDGKQMRSCAFTRTRAR
jgi:hypothetical protein